MRHMPIRRSSVLSTKQDQHAVPATSCEHWPSPRATCDSRSSEEVTPQSEIMYSLSLGGSHALLMIRVCLFESSIESSSLCVGCGAQTVPAHARTVLYLEHLVMLLVMHMSTRLVLVQRGSPKAGLMPTAPCPDVPTTWFIATTATPSAAICLRDVAIDSSMTAWCCSCCDRNGAATLSTTTSLTWTGWHLMVRFATLMSPTHH